MVTAGVARRLTMKRRERKEANSLSGSYFSWSSVHATCFGWSSPLPVQPRHWTPLPVSTARVRASSRCAHNTRSLDRPSSRLEASLANRSACTFMAMHPSTACTPMTMLITVIATSLRSRRLPPSARSSLISASSLAMVSENVKDGSRCIFRSCRTAHAGQAKLRWPAARSSQLKRTWAP